MYTILGVVVLQVSLCCS